MISLQGLQQIEARIASITQQFVPARSAVSFSQVLNQTQPVASPTTTPPLESTHQGYETWASEIDHAAHSAGIDPMLLAAVVRAESGFDPNALSSAGAIGLTQLMPATAGDLGVDPHDPIENLRGGATYLREMLDRFGDIPTALAAYNAGPGRVSQAGGIPDIPETTQYVDRVLTYYEQYGGAA